MLTTLEYLLVIDSPKLQILRKGKAVQSFSLYLQE